MKIKQYIHCAMYMGAMLLLFFMAGCGSNKVLVEGTIDKKLQARTIIKNHYNGELSFKTIRGRMRIDYKNSSESQSFTLSFRMEKDKTIWLSAPLSVVKVLITPRRVSFYNKLDNSFFDGDFSYLSNLLGTELDFAKVQNLLLGQAIFDLKKERYRSDIAENTYRLKPVKEFELFKHLFLVEPAHYKMAMQQIAQPGASRLLNVNYKTYQKVGEKVFPNTIQVTALQGNDQVNIDIEYRNIEFDQRVSFPYNIPRGYKEIALK